MADDRHDDGHEEPPRRLPQLQLFDASTYTPDTIDFSRDPEARQYWLHCFRGLIGKFAAQAAASDDADATERAEAYRLAYVGWLDALSSECDGDQAKDTTHNNNSATTTAASIRALLEHNEELLRQHGFADPWREVKRTENRHALGQLADRLAELDALCATPAAHWTELFRGLFAGNVFDWGAQAVTQIREQYDERRAFGLAEALGHIQPRPWLIDDLDRWLERIGGDADATIGAAPAHRCAAVFVDNSGADIVLGVLPFVRELLRLGTRVILCANRRPSLNDITCVELAALLDECCAHSETLRRAVAEGRLLVADNGQSGPCLDMRQLSSELTELIALHSVDLLIVEGMGRALHTNFNVRFACDTLKLAVVKNAWWAKRLGGANFAVICKFEPRRE